MCLLLVDDFLCLKLLFLLVLNVAEEEHEVAALAWGKFHLYILRGYGAPAVGVAVARTTFNNGVGGRFLRIESHEGLTVGVVALYFGVHGVEGVVVAALAVFCLMIDCGPFYLHLAG